MTDAHPTDLTQWQVNLLTAIAGADGEIHGLGVKEVLDEYYGESQTHGKLYPNLDDLVERGLVAKGEADVRTNWYALTDAGRRVLDGRIEWLQRQADHRLAGADPQRTGGEE